MGTIELRHIKTFSEFTFDGIVARLLEDLVEKKNETLYSNDRIIVELNDKKGPDILLKKGNIDIAAIEIKSITDSNLPNSIRRGQEVLLEYEKGKERMTKILLLFPLSIGGLELLPHDSIPPNNDIDIAGNNFLFELTNYKYASNENINSLRQFIIYDNEYRNKRLLFECIGFQSSEEVPKILRKVIL